MTKGAGLFFLALLWPGLSANFMESRFEIQNRNIGSLCSNMSPQMCEKSINETLVYSLLGCAIHCLRDPSCLSFNFQLLSYSPNQTHRCETTNQEAFALPAEALRNPGYNYYSRLGLP